MNYAERLKIIRSLISQTKKQYPRSVMKMYTPQYVKFIETKVLAYIKKNYKKCSVCRIVLLQQKEICKDEFWRYSGDLICSDCINWQDKVKPKCHYCSAEIKLSKRHYSRFGNTCEKCDEQFTLDAQEAITEKMLKLGRVKVGNSWLPRELE